VVDPEFPLTPGRRALGWASVLVFFLTFVVFPIRV
jgi:hypothetical protein